MVVETNDRLGPLRQYKRLNKGDDLRDVATIKEVVLSTSPSLTVPTFC